MKINWSKVPGMTPVRVKAKSRNLNGTSEPFVGNAYRKDLGILTGSKETPMLFVRSLPSGNVVCFGPMGSESGTWVFAQHDISMYADADHAKYSVLDPQETRDIKNCDRILENAMYGLFSIRDIADARLRGETIQYRPFTEHDAWIDATEQHIPDTDAYQYRIMPPSGCGAYCGEEKRDKIDAGKDEIVDQRRDKISDEVAAKHDCSIESAYKQWIANGVEEGLVDEAVKDRAMKMIISGTMKMEEVGIAPDTMDRLMPSALEFFKKAILQGHFDAEVRDRYGDLWVKEERVLPEHVCIALAVVPDGFCDRAVVKRFVQLMDNGALEARSPEDADAEWSTLDIKYHGTRPAIRLKEPSDTPQHRQFNDAAEAIPFLNRSIFIDGIKHVWFLIETLKREKGKEIGIGYVNWLGKQPILERMTFDEAFTVAKFDDGEPFGVKEE